MTTKTDIEQERRDFEKSMRIGGYKNLDLVKDSYEDQEVDAAWLGWKLRAALQSRVPAEQALAELVDKIIPGLDTGDLLADAQQASAALDQDREIIAEKDVEIRSLRQELSAMRFKLQGIDMREQTTRRQGNPYEPPPSPTPAHDRDWRRDPVCQMQGVLAGRRGVLLFPARWRLAVLVQGLLCERSQDPGEQSQMAGPPKGCARITDRIKEVLAATAKEWNIRPIAGRF